MFSNPFTVRFLQYILVEKSHQNQTFFVAKLYLLQGILSGKRNKTYYFQKSYTRLTPIPKNGLQ